MIVTMKAYEKLCIDYCRKFKSTWEYYCLSKDAYLQGYNDALTHGAMDTDVEVILDDHQIGRKSTG